MSAFKNFKKFLNRVSASNDEKQQARERVYNLLSNSKDLQTLNLILNADQIVRDLEMCDHIQLSNNTLIRYDNEKNQVVIKNPLD